MGALYSILKNPALLNLDAASSKRVLVRSRVLHIDRSIKDDSNLESENKSNSASVSTVVAVPFWILGVLFFRKRFFV